jgi:chitin disaccharide deacetylase
MSQKRKQIPQQMIINADDFGATTSVNQAILKCFNAGWISSTTIMANMPSFDEACMEAHRNHLVDRVGLHLVLSEGRPLSEPIKEEPRFCGSTGTFHRRLRGKRLLFLNAQEKKALATEIVAQIQTCRRNGLILTHLDSHHHFHEELAIISLIIPILKQYAIPHVRIMRNIGGFSSLHRGIYAHLYNRALRYFGVARTSHFGSIYNYMEHIKQNPSSIREGSFEIMVHPDLDASGNVIDGETKKPIKFIMSSAKLT